MAIHIEQQTIEELYERFAPELRGYLTHRLVDRNSVDDALQVTFIKLAEHLPTINPRAVRGWLYRVANNQANLMCRKRKTDERARKKISESIQPCSEAADASVMRIENIEQVRKGLNNLPEKLRVIVRLKFYEGMTFAEIADNLDTPLGTVLSRMRTAMQNLKAHFRDG